MTGFQFLEETLRYDVCYQSLSCTPVLHQENITSRWRSFNSGPIREHGADLSPTCSLE